MRVLLPSKKYIPIVFLAALLLALKVSAGYVYAINGDVSNPGTYANTNNPYSYYDVWVDKTAAGKNVKVNIDAPCTSGGNVGFIWGISSGASTNGVTNYSGFCSGGANSATLSFDISNPCLQEPNKVYCHAILYINAAGGSSGHFPYTLSIASGSGNPQIDFAGQDSTKWGWTDGGLQPPYDSWTRNFGMFTGGQSFYFAPPCNQNVYAYLMWSGVDIGASWQPNTPTVKLIDTTTGVVMHTFTKSEIGVYANPVGNPANSVIKDKGFTFKGGDKYKWDWSGLGSGNESVYSVPFAGNSFGSTQCFSLSSNTRANINGGAWKYSGNAGSVQSGDTVTFEHRILNNGPDTATYRWWVQGQLNGGTWKNNSSCGSINKGASPCSGCLPVSWPNGCGGNSDTGIGSGCWYPSFGTSCGRGPDEAKVTYQFPAGTPNGTVYCERIQYDNSTGLSGPNDTSTPVCVTYTTPNPTGHVDQADCQAGVTGWALDQNNPGAQIDVYAMYQSAQDGYQTHPYWYGSSGSGQVGTVWTGAYAADQPENGGHGFIIPIDPALYNGYQMYFYVYTRPATSFAGLPGSGSITPGYGATMMACAPFTTSGNTSVSLSPSLENPSSYSTLNYASVSISAANPSFNPSLGVPTCAVSVTYNSGPWGSASNSCNLGQNVPITGPSGATHMPPAAGDTYCSQLSLSYSSGVIRQDGSVFNTNGPLTVNSGCQKVYNAPYVHFLGADVFAGGGFGDYGNCSPITGTIKTLTDTTGYDYGGSAAPVGSSDQLGAFALGDILGFSSASLRGSAPEGSIGLSFSNVSNNVSGTAPGAPHLGGDLGGGACSTDYFSTKPSSLTSSTANSPVDISVSNATGKVKNVMTYYDQPLGTPLKISGGSIDAMSNETIYVKGDVEITGDIKFNSAPGCPSVGADDPCWGTIDDVPSLYIIDEGGSVYISNGVKQLDGIYVSQPDSGNNGGNIYTCSSGTSGLTTATDPNIFADCQNQLVVNGAFVDKATYLSRTFGSLRDSYPGEHLYGARPGSNPNCGDSGAAPLGDCSAEIFNFSPEIYLSQPDITPNSGPTTGKYDYITSLSPIL